MGASIIGHPCARYVWLSWRWVKKAQFSGRVLRMFDTGKREESRLLEELRGIGAQVWDTDPNTGEQWRVSACDGHFGGSLDGVAKGLPEAPKTAAVIEFKTHNAKSFADLLSKKVAGSKPQHFDQLQIYMGLMELERALYLAVNKDTDDVYVEWIHFDKDHFENLIDYAQGLIAMPTPPEPISNDPSNWQCKGCTFHEVCHGGIAADANCRTCCHASPIVNSAWHCGHHNNKLDEAKQRKGCGDHLLIPALTPYAQAIDGGPSWVAYKHRQTGQTFVNGNETVEGYGQAFTSSELQRCPSVLLGEAASIKEEFPGAEVISGGIAWNTPEDLDKDSKPETKKERTHRSKIAKSLRNLEQMAQ